VETNNPTTPRLLLTVRQAADALSICEKSLWNLTQPRGPLPAVRIGRAVRFSISDLQAFIESRKAVGND